MSIKHINHQHKLLIINKWCVWWSKCQLN